MIQGYMLMARPELAQIQAARNIAPVFRALFVIIR
jgi:hypothetical protein